MVSARHNAEESLIILRPNRSADWRANRNLLLSLAALSCVISTGFALLGAWVILPFAGLEIAVLGGGRVGSALADRWREAGHEVAVSSRKTVAQAAARAEVVVLAVPAAAAADVLAEAGPLGSAVLIDATNNLSGAA